MSAQRLGIGVIGAGRVGTVLANALRSLGHAVVGVTAVSDDARERVELLLPGVEVVTPHEVIRRAEVVLVTVPDDAVADVVSGAAALGLWQVGQIVVHTSGVHGLDVLEPARATGALPLAIHPAMTFTGTSIDLSRLSGCPFAVTAPSALLPIAQALVVEIGGEPFVVPPADRTAYHAALTHGANHLVTLVAQAERILAATGIDSPGRLLGPLLNAALEGVLADGELHLTGPVVRGDVGTIREHLQARAAHRAADNHRGDPPMGAPTAARAGA
ncbi:MAG: DUF2520 domain-containing protein, partial [Actinomycetes bacterium]|nr:DUF2520 domain-containing protein [Actinomycetes bacterium]MDX5400438.1 DUF2520 domain-containing protein [Actinomycetes bacterium]